MDHCPSRSRRVHASAGAAQVEFALLVVGIGMVALAAITFFGQKVAWRFGNSTARLDGAENVAIGTRPDLAQGPMPLGTLGGDGDRDEEAVREPRLDFDEAGDDGEELPPASAAGPVAESEGPDVRFFSTAPDLVPSRVQYRLVRNDALGYDGTVFLLDVPASGRFDSNGELRIGDPDDARLYFASRGVEKALEELPKYGAAPPSEDRLRYLRGQAAAHRDFAESLAGLARDLKASGRGSESEIAGSLAEANRRLADLADGIADEMDLKLEPDRAESAYRRELRLVEETERRIRELRGLVKGSKEFEAALGEIRRAEDELAEQRDALRLRDTAESAPVAEVIDKHLSAVKRDLLAATDEVRAFSRILEGSSPSARPGETRSATVTRPLPAGGEERITVERTTGEGGRSTVTITRIRRLGTGPIVSSDDSGAKVGAQAGTAEADVTHIFYDGDRRTASVRFTLQGPQADVEARVGQGGAAAGGSVLIGGDVRGSVTLGDPLDPVIGARETSIGATFLKGSAGVAADDTRKRIEAQFDVAEARGEVRTYRRVGGSVVSLDAGGSIGIGAGIAVDAKTTSDPARGDRAVSLGLEGGAVGEVGITSGAAVTRVRRGVDDSRRLPPEVNDVFDDLYDGKVRGGE